ncbi:hypothetical protein CKM354_000093200 [Cercospora kikuchii]|uniref:RBR-type E3 ubiquitin transferase n=1 Tax=Cercospora kikuchii TaxID=84275 RepID=A0A9P3FBG5_9PEZI|nr:uncharacterized protein CKM354_000093200 [Cercospora kikuchii]GIZ37487.1 hypothetical protein CKM354_000093200 [Cercospora kikuchii]
MKGFRDKVQAQLTKSNKPPKIEVHEIDQDDFGLLKRSNARLHRRNQSSINLDEPSLPDVFEGYCSLQRPAAKLKKHDSSDDIIEPIPGPSLPQRKLKKHEDDEDIIDVVPGPSLPPAKLKKCDSMKSESVASEPAEQEYKTVRIPVGMYGWREERVPVKPKKKSFASKAFGSKSRFSVFGGSKQVVETDLPVQSRESGGLVASHIPEIDNVNLHEAAVSAQETRVGQDIAVPRKPVPGEKGKQPAIAKGDWSEFDQQQMRDVVELSKRLSASPVDSGIGLEEDDNHTWHTAQSRASMSPMAGGSRQLDIPQDDMAEVLALEAALQLEIEQRQQEWDNRMKAIALRKEKELQRIRQEELDRLQALELQKEEEARFAAEEAERNRPRGCVCCGDDKPPAEFPSRPTTLSCEHENHTCVECMHSWLAAEFETKGTEDLKCPECPCKLDYDDILAHSTPETFDSYEKMLTRNALSSLDEFAWCLSATCNSGQLNVENASGTFMDCVGCGYKQCLTHKVAWHTGETCEQYEYRTSGAKAKDEERATEAMLDTVSKKCPGANCGWRIQKIDGCDHMRCKKCKFEFCWMCLASHKEIKKVGNTAHATWCTAGPRRTYHAQAWDNDTHMPADF